MPHTRQSTLAAIPNKKPVNFLDRVLQPPSYGWRDQENQLITPGTL
jgi:hypothetical protein